MSNENKMEQAGPEKRGIYVCALDDVDELLGAGGISHMVSVINEYMIPPTPPAMKAEKRHLRLAMNDISFPIEGYIAPDGGHVRKLIDFISRWRDEGGDNGGDGDGAGHLLVHCWAGISRSTAAAYICLCHLNPQRDEYELARLLRARSPSATPNPLMVKNADDILQRKGRMVEAIEIIGRGEVARSGQPFFLPANVPANGDDLS